MDLLGQALQKERTWDRSRCNNWF